MRYRKGPSSLKRRQFILAVGVVAGYGISVQPISFAQPLPPKGPPKPPARPHGRRTFGDARVQIGEAATDGPTWQFASRSLQFPWRQPGGDWIDADGNQNGATPHALISVTGINPPPIDVTTLVKRLQVDNCGILLHMPSGGTPPAFMSRQSAIPPRLSVTTDAGVFDCACVANCWIDATSNQTLSGEMSAGGMLKPSAMLKFDITGVKGMLQSGSLTLALSRWYGPTTVAVDYLDMPFLVTDPVRQIGGALGGLTATVANDRDLASHQDILFYSECSSEDVIRSKWSFVSPNYPGGKVCINPQFVSWPEVGLTALRMESQAPSNLISGDSGSSILTWREYPANGKTYRELYTRYLLKIDPDVYVGMNELGVKLPGFEGSGFSYRMEHGAQSAANPGVFRLVMYTYDATRSFDDPNRGSLDRKTLVCLKAAQLYSIEQHVKLNTLAPDGSANPDGIIEIFVDGVLVYADYKAQVSASANATITSMPFANFFHGGSTVPKAPIHYEFSGIATSQRYIGPVKTQPVTKSATWPSWRRNMIAGQVSSIPGSSLARLGANNPNAINAWTGLAAGTGAWYSAANGGHTDSSDNGVYSIDLTNDAPGWKVLHPATGTTSIPSAADAAAGRLEYYRDGRPAARHSYYSPQVIGARNRVMLFYCAAAWGNGNANDPVVDGFRLDVNEWDPQGAWHRGLVRNTLAQCVAKHPQTEDVYCAMNGEFAKWTQMTGEWSALVPRPAVQLQFCGSLIDAKRNRWVFSSGKSLSIIDLSTLGYTKTALTGIANEPNFDDYNNVVHDTNDDAYIVCCSDGRVYRIDPDSGLTAKTSQLPAARNGVQNRFAYFDSLGGVAYYPEYSSDILFLATA